MAVLIVMDWDESEADYFGIVSRMGVQGTPAEGIHVHVAGPTAGGVRIVELWDELAEFEAFVDGVLLPTAEAAGITTKPVYVSFPVANLFAPGLKEIEKLAQQFAG
ncbi:hypothetical protein [Catenulispora pinisilvae]|uniref:hypothetical protein n=1 Tax=Catenulispora pinisilvae TaxID=2705253 RepID=UPI0018915EB7|nr:hypothetical protein [Catenulispora pinisilvae]